MWKLNLFEKFGLNKGNRGSDTDRLSLRRIRNLLQLHHFLLLNCPRLTFCNLGTSVNSLCF